MATSGGLDEGRTRVKREDAAGGKGRRIICILICILKHGSVDRASTGASAKYDRAAARRGRRINVVKVSYTTARQPDGHEIVHACRS